MVVSEWLEGVIVVFRVNLFNSKEEILILVWYKKWLVLEVLKDVFFLDYWVEVDKDSYLNIVDLVLDWVEMYLIGC